jgi:hypothetical protein
MNWIRFVPYVLPFALPLVNNGLTALAKKATGAKGIAAFLLNIAFHAASAATAVVVGAVTPEQGVALGVGSAVASQVMWHSPESVKGPVEDAAPGPVEVKK